MQAETSNGKTQVVILGTGDTIISDVYMDDGRAGVTFANGETQVGKHHPERDGREVPDLDDYLMVITDNPDSIQVLIDKLEIAKSSLLMNDCADSIASDQPNINE